MVNWLNKFDWSDSKLFDDMLLTDHEGLSGHVDRMYNRIVPYSPSEADYHQMATYDFAKSLEEGYGKGTSSINDPWYVKGAKGIRGLGLTLSAYLGSYPYDLIQGQNPIDQAYNRGKGAWEHTKNIFGKSDSAFQRMYNETVNPYMPDRQMGEFNTERSPVKREPRAANFLDPQFLAPSPHASKKLERRRGGIASLWRR